MGELPTTIRVAHRDYSVWQWGGLEAQANRRLGESDHLALIIRVREGLSPAVAAEVLLHEILHCCWWNGNVHDQDDEERTVTALANQLTLVWRDNPDLGVFLSNALTPPTQEHSNE